MILVRGEGENLSRVERAWEGETVVCIATGPSLSEAQIALVRASGARVIAVNDAYLMAPFADVLYFADVKWHNWHKDREEFRAFAGQKCSIFIGVDQKLGPSVYLLKQAGYMGLSNDPTEIVTGSNSGYQAINIAALSGARRIVLLGYDAQPKDGKHHFFGAHPDKSHAPYDVIRGRFRDLVQPLRKLGVEVFNATPGSAISAFGYTDLAASLEPHPRSAVV